MKCKNVINRNQLTNLTMSKSNIIVSIEGNIGSGKSTLLSNLQKYFQDNKKVVFLKEPVDEWATIRDENNVTMLEKFYADQKTYSFPFQMMAYISRLALLKKAMETNEDTVIITERSLYTDRLVFAKMLFDSGNIELVNYKVYLKWFDTFVTDYPIDYIIYVNADPEICHQRIMERSRQGESNIPLSYLKSCYEYHTQMIYNDENGKYICSRSNLLTLDGNINIYENPSKLEEWIDSIKKIVRM